MDGLRAGIDEAVAYLGVARPGWNQPPAEQGDRAGAVVISAAGGKALTGRTVVASPSIRRQRRSTHAVQVENLLGGQLLGETASRRCCLRVALGPRSSCGYIWGCRPRTRRVSKRPAPVSPPFIRRRFSSHGFSDRLVSPSCP